MKINATGLVVILSATIIYLLLTDTGQGTLPYYYPHASVTSARMAEQMAGKTTGQSSQIIVQSATPRMVPNPRKSNTTVTVKTMTHRPDYVPPRSSESHTRLRDLLLMDLFPSTRQNDSTAGNNKGVENAGDFNF